MYKNFRKYEYEVLKIKAEKYLQEIEDLKDALAHIPESSVLGHMAVSAILAKKRKEYSELKEEIAFREFREEYNK